MVAYFLQSSNGTKNDALKSLEMHVTMVGGWHRSLLQSAPEPVRISSGATRCSVKGVSALFF